MKPRIIALALTAVLPVVLAIPVVGHALAAAPPAIAPVQPSPEVADASAPVTMPLGQVVVASTDGDAVACGSGIAGATGGKCATRLASVTPDKTSSGPAPGLFASGGALAVKVK